MSAQDEEFMQRLRATFQVEAQEHLHAISTTLLEMEKSSPSVNEAAAIESVYRAAHSLKGAARAVDLSEIEHICQAFEGLFSLCKQTRSGPLPESFDTLHQAVDAISALLGPQVRAPQPVQNISGELIRRLNGIRPRQLSDEHSPPDKNKAAPPIEVAAIPAVPPASSTPAMSEAIKPAGDETVRVSIAKLDSRLLQAEDMLAVKTMTARRAAELHDLSASLEQWRKEWARISSRSRVFQQSAEQRGSTSAGGNTTPAALAAFLEWNHNFFRTLEGKLIPLSNQAAQDRRSVEKRVDDLLEDSKKLLMLPFATIGSMLPRLVRDLCRDQGKQADFTIEGGDVEIDKRILEELKDPLIHILRNCIDHGVEAPAERVQLHKPAQATIRAKVTPIEGSKVEIAISDDGRGVNLERLKNSAVNHGILSETDSRAMNEMETLDLAFHPDVTSSPTVTAISGRGLGMAIVREKVEKLGGRVSIESRRGTGTSIRILLPLTLATFRGILVMAANQIVVAPIVSVERVLRVKPEEIQTVENRETLSLNGRVLSVARLAAVLELPPPTAHIKSAARLSVIILQSAGQRIAFVVDDVLHEEEVLVKALRKPLLRVRNIAGATVLASGKSACILNVADLIKSARGHGAVPAQVIPAGTTTEAPGKKVLVVEDSITSRMLLKGILESAGFHVKTAVDGVEGFTTLREEDFDLVVSDVEMPRMNGFDLTARIRLDKRLANLPVVLVTALELREERERGIDAGADAYVVKSTFDQSNLLEVIRRLI